MPPTYTKIDVDRITGIAKAVHLATRQAQNDAYNASTFQDKIRYNQEYLDAAKSADAFIYAAIIGNKRHRYRSLFYEKQVVASGDELPNEFTGGVEVQIGGTYYGGSEQLPDVPGTLSAKKPNYGGVSTTLDQGYYGIRGNQIYFTGGAARVEFCPIVPGSFPMTPVDYELAVLYGVLAITSPSEGAFIEMANHYGTLWGKALDAIKEEGQLPDDSPPYSLIYSK